MTKKKKSPRNNFRLFVIASLAFLSLFVLLTFKTHTSSMEDKNLATPIPKTTIKLGEVDILVEIADTTEKRALGLSYRASLPENEGMLFDFGPMKTPVRFWMKGMNFPLDLIYIADGKVVQIHENAQPEPGVSDNNLKSYIPNEAINYVLEVNGGFSEKNNIKKGDSFSF